MAIAELAAKVTWSGGLTVAAITAGAWWVAGAPAAAGGGVGRGVLTEVRRDCCHLVLLA